MPRLKILAPILLLSILSLSHCDSPTAEEEKKPWDYGPWDYYNLHLELNTKVRAIYMTTPNSGWACVSGPKFLHYANGDWTIFKDFKKEKGEIVAQFMNDMDFSTPNDGWAVGNSMYPDTGYIFHYDGRDWEDVTPFTMKPLYCVAALAPDDVWAAGWYDTAYHYDGSSWTLVPMAGGMEVEALHFPAPDDGWAVGYNGTCFHYDGLAWRAVNIHSYEHRYGVFFPSREEGWAVGGGGLTPESPAWYPVLHYENGEWNEMFRADMKLLGVHFASPSDGWAVGTHILRYDGEKWRQITPPGKLVAIDVFTLGGDEVWISCDHGTICKYNPNK